MIARVSMFVCLAAVLVYSGAAMWQTHHANDDRAATEADSVRAMGLGDVAPKHLGAGFTSAGDTLLADVPKNRAQLVDPPELVVAHLKEDADSPLVSWPLFDAQLASATGKKVSDVVVDNAPSQLDRIKSGEFTIMALHGPDVPFLVNNCGYQPVAALADSSGVSGNRCDLVVPAKSLLHHPEDLRGRTLTCTGPLSIVGYRAAILLLMRNQHLRPNLDYFVSWSLGQNESITGVADGTYEAAAVSDDKLHTMLDSNDVNESSYHIIYQSDVLPRMVVGYFYNLKPDLAAKVRQAVLAYRPADTRGNQKSMHFNAVDYKKDFAFIRDIDDHFDPRMESKAKHSEPTTGPSAP